MWGNLFIQLIFRREGTCLQKGDGLNLRMIDVAPEPERLQAIYGANFAYFDPNIWWNEDEMRKQVEQLNGCFVLTGKVRVCRQRCIGKSNVRTSSCMCLVCDENDGVSALQDKRRLEPTSGSAKTSARSS